ncbi:PAS domain S-box-containing protein [Blastococcus sp. DSM 46786]|uniref:SpoIIE family protein phosphatase n=1 Tax=Blastococcus sp. DSM 46786 TaxID=1798227 RepID=UPI0008B7B6DB|nr:SpoIIE family protein phosphatase [Blastococcus sp. DSM 46786]SEK78707.1 PAS domain S-box-containing protein [Blastococcus sp. DSM 46786]
MPGTGPMLPADALLAALADTVVVADGEGRIAYVSPSVTSLLGHDPAAVTGLPLQVLMPERLRHGHTEGFSRYRATGEGKLVGATTRVPALHAAGHEVPVDLTLSRLTPIAGEEMDALVVAVLRDASTTILLERQFEVSRYLAATLRITAALTEAPDADVAFAELLPTLCTELDWDAAQLWQPDGDGSRLVHAGTWTAPGATVPALEADAAGRTFRRGEGLPGEAWQQRATVSVEDFSDERAVVRVQAARDDGLRTGVAFPVFSGNMLLAVCELFSTTHRPVPPELTEVLSHAGRQIGQFLARLRAESVVRELADTLQRSLLPSHLPTIPGVELAATYRAGGGTALVGGDTYDVTPLPDGRWMVLIADVCGTGAEAAAVTAVTRHTARAAATGSPAEILRAVNGALLHEQGAGPLRFVTACCLVLEPAREGLRLRLTVAGHPLPLLTTSEGGACAVGTAGRPLGIDADLELGETSLDLPPGATLVLYTDGVTEARDDAGRQFGEDALLRVVAGAPVADAEAVVAAVSDAVERQLSGSRHEPDDLAVLALSVPR